MPFGRFVFLVLVVSWPAAVAAQAPSPTPPPPQALKPGPPADQPKKDALPEDEVRIRADASEMARGHGSYRGFVDLRAADMRIQADKLDVYEETKADGKLSRMIVAEGNVVFMRGDERLSGRRMTMDLTASTGVFEDAVGYVQPGVFVEGKRIERLDASKYKIEGGKFTSCAQPNPRWSFSATSATLEVDDHIAAKNVTFKVKSVPALFLPYFVYPIQKDQRSTGILFPHFGYSSFRGFNIGTGFFWAMGRSADQTFYFDQYSRYGYGLGHEVRYTLKSPSRGSLRTYFFRPTGIPGWEYDVNWTAVQSLPHSFRGSLFVRQYSNLSFQQQIQESLDLVSRRTRSSSLNIQRNFKAVSVQALADSTETFFEDQHRVNRHVPSLVLSRSPQKLHFGGLVFGYETRAEGLQLGDQDRLDYYSRFDLYPRLSRPLSASFLQLTPALELRYTRYGTSLLDDALDGPPIDRRYLEGSMDMRGPTFSRVFNLPGHFYTDRIKHVIGPEVTWTYRSPVDRFDEIPKFDGNDYYLGTNEVNYALVQRFYAKRAPRPGAKAEAYEFLNWRLQQTYYVQIGDNQGEFDPNYSSSAFGPGGQPDHNSPVQSRLRLRPTPEFNTNFDLEYDVNFHQLRTLGLSASLNRRRGSVQASWSRGKRVAAKAENRVLNRDTLRGSGRLEVLPGKLSLESSADYDLLNKVLRQSTARIRYGIQCCGFTVETIQSEYGVKKDRQFRFAIELANVGSIGNFMGEDQSDQKRGFGSVR
jgi:lipopolysaccharide assembly outer membrane protein LptD (OstA)